MSKSVAKIPEGFHTVTPYIAVKGGEEALAHYEEALGANTEGKMMMPGGGSVMHACFRVGNSKIFLTDAGPLMSAPKDGEAGHHFYLYVDDVDAAHKRAVKAGMTEDKAPEDQIWGDRMSRVTCKFGHHWTLATHVRDVSPEEMAEAMEAMAS